MPDVLSDAKTSFFLRGFDCARIPHEDRSFDLVIANHVLFYCEDISAVCSEIQRVLTPGGKLICSTYGKKHMQEVSRLVRDFDDRIVLSADKLYERFGRENGADILAPYFSRIFWESYEDSLPCPRCRTADFLYPLLPWKSESVSSGQIQRFPWICIAKDKGWVLYYQGCRIFLCEK